MITLLLDSSNTLLVVGLAKDNKVIDKTIYKAWQKQSEFMILEIEKILKRNNVDPKSVGEIVVSKGPGSYTGVRIALTIAKIYGYALNIPVFAVSSLQMLMEKNKPSICLMNARSARSYIGVYNNNEILMNDQVLTNEEVKKYIEEHPEYEVMGEVSYLNLEEKESDILNNMLFLRNENSKVENILTLKAIYLKD